MSDEKHSSILSLTLNFRQLVRVYGFGKSSKYRKGGDVLLICPSALIDEIDAHLHPIWQTRIGQWFL